MSPTPAPASLTMRASKRRAPRFDATLFFAGTSSVLAFALPAPQHDAIAGLPSICPWHSLTGIPCPGCGLTRSVVCCTHGLWHQALIYHPLGPLALAGMISLTVWRLAYYYPPTRLAVSHRTQKKFATALFALLLVTWGVRLAGFWPLPP